MFVDARELDTGTPLRCDVCVIGAGAAGITLALKLRRSGLDVIVLESGGEAQDAETQGLYIGETSGQPYLDLAIARLRFLGGSTNHWGGTCRPFAADDFEQVPGTDVPGWPIALGDIDPFYDEAGVMCGLRWPVSRFDDAADNDTTGPLELDPADFVGRFNQIVDTDRRSFGTRYRDELEETTDIAVHLWANVTEIMVDASGTTATGARVATLTGVRYAVESKVVVLATGGLENPRLMLASKGAGPSGLGNGHDCVGRFFMEHPRFIAARIIPADSAVTYEWYSPHVVEGVRYQGYSGLAARRQRIDGLTDVQLRLTPRFSQGFEEAVESQAVRGLERVEDWFGDGSRPELGRDLLQIAADLTTVGDWFVPGGPVPVPLPDVLDRLLSGRSTEREALVPGLFGDVAASLWERGVSQPPVELVEVTARISQVPDRASRVTLTEQVDRLGMPLANLHWQLGEIDRRSAVRTLELFGAELAANGSGRVQLSIDDEGDWPLDLRGGWHHMGTTRMSAAPEDGVVDANCQVHGVSNLFVAGSSVFATASSATPTLTLVALALRLAEHLVNDVL